MRLAAALRVGASVGGTHRATRYRLSKQALSQGVADDRVETGRLIHRQPERAVTANSRPVRHQRTTSGPSRRRLTHVDDRTTV